MSYTIQVNSAAFSLPEGSLDLRGYVRHEKEFFWFVRIGDNNVSPFSPRWTFQKSGWNYEVVQEVCRQAGYCEGGMLKFGTRPESAQWITPEIYLADFREKAAAAKTLTLTNLINVRHGTIGFSNVKKSVLDNAPESPAIIKLDDFRRERILEAVAVLQSEYQQEKDIFYKSADDEETFTFRRKLTNVEDFLRWIKLKEDLKPLGVWTVHE